MNSVALPAWVREFFGSTYAACDLDWPRERQDAVAAGVMDLLRVRAGARVLDQCCGTGSLSLGLARRGIQTVAIDQSAAYVEAGRAAALAEGLPGEWAVGDAAAWAPSLPVDGSVSWHSSIGYGGPQGARALLGALRAPVNPGCRWLVEIGNRDHFDLHFKPDWSVERTLPGEGLVRVRRQGQWDGDELVQDWTVERDERVLWSCTGTRYWHPRRAQVTDIAREWGDRWVGTYADAGGGPWSAAAPRTILVFERAP